MEVYLPRYPVNQRLKGEVIYDGPLKPPIKHGDQVAMLRVTSSTGAQSQVPLYAAEDVERAAGALAKLIKMGSSDLKTLGATSSSFLSLRALLARLRPLAADHVLRDGAAADDHRALHLAHPGSA